MRHLSSWVTFKQVWWLLIPVRFLKGTVRPNLIGLTVVPPFKSSWLVHPPIYVFNFYFLSRFFHSSNKLGRTACNVHRMAFFQQTGLQKMRVPYISCLENGLWSTKRFGKTTCVCQKEERFPYKMSCQELRDTKFFCINRLKKNKIF